MDEMKKYVEDQIPDLQANAETQSRSQPFHAMAVEQIQKFFGTDLGQGLSTSSIAPLRERHGFNELEEEPSEPVWKKILGQFNAFVIWILIGAAVISGLLNEWTDAFAILAIVLLNAILGFFQEQKAEKALAALQKMSAPMAKVIRDGKLQNLPARELVPGDRIELEAGDNIPADARLLEAFGLRVQEASLTGETATTKALALPAAITVLM